MEKPRRSKRRPRTVALIPSAGKGVRMGSGPKIYLDLLGKPLLAHTLLAFEKSAFVDSIIVVAPPGQTERCARDIIRPLGLKKVMHVLDGGSVRQDSVAAALSVAAKGFDIIAVHDGARPLVTEELIERVIKGAIRWGAAVPAVEMKDTVKEVSRSTVKRTVERDTLRGVQTPQAFRTELLVEAFERAAEEGFTGTDEAALVERLGVKVRAVEGSYENIKITTPEDMLVAECILRNRPGARG